MPKNTKKDKSADKSRTDGPLVVKPIEIDESALNKIEEDWWVHPGLYVGIGSVASGKSTLLANFLDYWYDIFENRVILFSPSLHNDPIIKKLMDEDRVFSGFETYTNDTLDAVLNVIKEDEETPEGKGKKWLIIADDTLSQIPKSNSREAKYFNSYISRYRHYPVEGKISIVMFTQYYKDLNPVIRCNTSVYMFLGAHSEKNKKVYAEELSTLFNGDEDKFRNAWNSAKKSKYDILTLNMRQLTAYRNFDTKIYSRDDDLEQSAMKDNEKENEGNASDSDADQMPAN